MLSIPALAADSKAPASLIQPFTAGDSAWTPFVTPNGHPESLERIVLVKERVRVRGMSDAIPFHAARKPGDASGYGGAGLSQTFTLQKRQRIHLGTSVAAKVEHAAALPEGSAGRFELRVDGTTVAVKELKTHGRRQRYYRDRLAGTADLAPGPHTVSIVVTSLEEAPNPHVTQLVSGLSTQTRLLPPVLAAAAGATAAGGLALGASQGNFKFSGGSGYCGGGGDDGGGVTCHAPEPPAVVLLTPALGLLGLVSTARKRRKAAQSGRIN